MWQVTLKLMRNSLRMLIPAGIAIVIGTAFIASTFLFGNALDASIRRMVSANFGDANHVATVTSSGSGSQPLPSVRLGDVDLDRIRAIPGVEGARPDLDTAVNLTYGSKHSSTVVSPMTQPAGIMVQRLVEGSWPSGDGQIALARSIADRLGAHIGDTIDVASGTPSVAPGRARETLGLTVTGYTQDDYYLYYGGSGVVSGAAFDRLAIGYPSAADMTVSQIFLDIAAPAGSDERAVIDAVASRLPAGFDVYSRAQYEEDALRSMGAAEGASIITQFLLVFGILALFVAALVIANTFQVMVAQRRRTLALLRTIGARRRQLYASVVFESAVLGLVSSAVGVALALGFVGALSAARVSVTGMTFSLIPSWQVFAVPIGFGVVMTILASLSSARTATTVTPLEALQPLELTQERRSGRARFVLSVTLMALGVVAAALVVWQTWRYLHRLGSVMDMDGTFAVVLLTAIGAAIAFFVGLLLSAVRWMPALLKGVGALVSHCGPSATLAAANIQRNRRRVAATGAALLIGVTLVSCLGTGAACAKASLAGALDMRYSVDMQVTAAPGSVIDQSTLERISGVKGVQEARLVDVMQARYGDVTSDDAGYLTLYGISSADARAVMNADYAADMIADGTLVVPLKHIDSSMGIRDGGELTVLPGDFETVGADGSTISAKDPVTLRTRVSDFRRVGSDTQLFGLVSPATFASMRDSLVAAGSPQGGESHQIWVRVSPDAVPVDLLNAVQDAVSDDPGIEVTGGFAERAVWDRNVNMVLMVMVALLAVAVVIALIGVANTLSLSVIERTRESATLRAIGMTRGQLRRSLAVEALLIALASGVVGVIVGNLFAWLGSYVMFSQFETVRLTVDWGMTGIILAVAAVSALLASVFPARRAVRTPPVEALAEA